MLDASVQELLELCLLAPSGPDQARQEHTCMYVQGQGSAMLCSASKYALRTVHSSAARRHTAACVESFAAQTVSMRSVLVPFTLNE